MKHDEPTREQSHDRYFIAGCDSFYQELEADPFLQTRGISRCGSDLCLFDQPQSVRQGETQYFAVGSYGSQSFAFKCDIGLVGIGADYVTTCIL